MEQFESETSDLMLLQQSVRAQAETEWEADPTVWQRLDEETAYYDPSPDRMGVYADPDVLEEYPTVAEAMLSLPRYQGVSPEFGRYLRAIVLTRHAQLAPDRVSPVGRAEFEAMRPEAQLAAGLRLQALADEVFSWMSGQGMDPFPGRSELPRLVTDEVREVMLTPQG
ncbi:hypothetical protein AAG742_03455 [Micrococcus sp. 2A]|uniref:hypothetical protein n=1 Tax=Micrococcus sp. 2A TaxID=3142261 RepID=UPI0031BA8573